MVYNAHYLTFVDDAFDCWLRELNPTFETALGWEVMVKRAEITWSGPARFGNTIEIGCAVSRWGNTSFDVAFSGAVGDDEVFESSLTYVVVDHEDFRPMPVPDALRSHLGG
ncbi:MAG: acyl-CoA thioesterase [Acidimicrobiales bacterium]